ncbi:MAG: MarR family transcriptional regulator [Bacilli bacterium]|nr:MarR family transcriptional regulator [Bacilli bacterium]
MKNEECLRLENQICFPMYVASKEIVRRYIPLLNKLDLTYTQYITLLALWEKDHITVKELGEKLYLDSGTLTPLLNKLEKKGYIIKNKSDKDGRELVVIVTTKGLELKQKALEVPPEIAKCVNLKKEEAIVFYQLLHKVLDGFYVK